MVDWNMWLGRYDRPWSPHSQRLSTVRGLIDRHIESTAPNPIVALSICAGDGRDLLHVLGTRTDSDRVRATLVELNPSLCSRARAQAAREGLTSIEIRQADAGKTDTYADLPKADLIILVGVFGNISDKDVETTIDVLPALCQPDGLVIWSLRQMPRRKQQATRFKNDRERVNKAREWFEVSGYEETFLNRRDASFHVGSHRFVGDSKQLKAAERFFTFDLPSATS